MRKTDGTGCAKIDRRRLLQMKKEKTEEELHDVMRYLNDEIMMEIDTSHHIWLDKCIVVHYRRRRIFTAVKKTCVVLPCFIV